MAEAWEGRPSFGMIRTPSRSAYSSFSSDFNII